MTGHRCSQAYTGREALRAAKQERPHLVLLDINLPDMDGFQVMAQIGEISVIYVTARDEVTDRSPCCRVITGRNDFVFLLYQPETHFTMVLSQKQQQKRTTPHFISAVWSFLSKMLSVSVQAKRLRPPLSPGNALCR